MRTLAVASLLVACSSTPSSTPDLAQAPDLVVSADMGRPPDLVVAQDLEPSVDGAVRDFTAPDLVVPPDLSTAPDLIPACDGGATICAGACVDTNSDVANCGACGNQCKLANATAVCTSGACAITSCNKNFVNCNHDASDGCEIHVTADHNNCGACGNTCPSAQGCAAGQCVNTSCGTGWADCQLTGTGCYTSLATDELNCGACHHVCPAHTDGTAPACVNGLCQ